MAQRSLLRGVGTAALGLLVLASCATLGESQAIAREPVVKGQNSCAGVPVTDQQSGMFDAKTLAAVKPIERREGKQMYWRPVGAEVLLWAKPGQSPEWLQRVAACKQAQAAVTGGSGVSPLAVDNAQVSVTRAGPMLSVRITAPTAREAREIQQRALALLPTGSAEVEIGAERGRSVATTPPAVTMD